MEQVYRCATQLGMVITIPPPTEGENLHQYLNEWVTLQMAFPELAIFWHCVAVLGECPLNHVNRSIQVYLEEMSSFVPIPPNVFDDNEELDRACIDARRWCDQKFTNGMLFNNHNGFQNQKSGLIVRLF